ncbi:MAG: YitT family protein [Clostridia bacterium]|nr:YitT family protein [Clostridia bacterium]
MIVTDKPEEISSALMEAFDCGTTKIAVTGGYSNMDKTIIYFVVNRFQIARMRDIILSIDKKAFVTISEVADVFKAND